MEHSILKVNRRKRQNSDNIEEISSDKGTSTEDIQLDKLDILALNNGWNDKNEKFIVSIGENSASYKYMHEKVSFRYTIYDRIIKIFMTILTVIVMADYYTTISHENEYIRILQIILSSILAIISLIYNFLSFAELSKDHIHSASSFGIVYHDIRNIMCLYRKDRPNAIKYIQYAIKEYDHLEVNSANIPNWQLIDFEKKFKDKNISIPDIADRIQKIEIISEPGNIKSNNVINNKTNFTINNTNNLSNIQECFKIDGDLSENDNLTYSDLVKRKDNLNKQSEYEMNRFMSHIVKNNPDNLV